MGGPGDAFVSVRGSLLRPHACTKSATHVRRGARLPIMAGRRAVAGAVSGPRNAQER